jgi:hypothetical protein
MEEVGRPVFERHEVRYTERRDDKQTAESFRIEGSWLRGAEVDRLSLEEAREIAETSAASATKDGLVSVEEAGQIKSDTRRGYCDNDCESRMIAEIYASELSGPRSDHLYIQE